MRYLKKILESLLYFSIVILSQRIAYLGYGFLAFYLSSNEEKALQTISRTQTIPILMGWVFTISIILLVFKILKQKPLKILGGEMGFVNGLLAIVIGLGMVLITNGIVSALDIYHIIGQFSGGYEVISGNFLWTVLAVGLIIPIFEELVFRGFIMGKLLEISSTWFVIIFQALLFSISHFNSAQGVSVFLLGIVAGFCVVKTRSVRIGMIIHGVFNITNLYLNQMDHHYYDIGQLLALTILGIFLIYFGLDKLVGKNLRYQKAE